MPRSRLLAAALVLAASVAALDAGPGKAATITAVSGTASCTISITGTGYQHSETQSWQVGGPLSLRGSITIVPSHWTDKGSGSKHETQGTQVTDTTWTVNAASDGQFQVFIRASDNQFVIGQANTRPGIPNGITGTRQVTIGGVPQTPQSISFSAFELQLPPITGPATSPTVSGSTPPTVVTGSFGPIQPGGAVVTQACRWSFTVATGVPPPVLGKSVDVQRVSGTVLVNGAPLTAETQIKVGARVDTTHGTVRLRSANGTGTFHDGTFRIAETARKGQPTELQLRLASLSACGAKRKTSAASPKVLDSLWGDAKGTFRTKGRYAAAAVRGTLWRTVDRCDGTLIVVRRGVVDVRDLKRGTTTSIRAGHQLLVKP